eukprot:scpid109228/ scgid34207/ 
MPGHASCIVLFCPNRKDRCKWGLVESDEKRAGRKFYVKRRLCQSTLARKGCDNCDPACKSLSFHRLPADSDLRKKWLQAIPRANVQPTPNSYVCGVHFGT